MRRVPSILLAVVLAGAAVALQAAHWSYERAYGPFVRNGQVGRTLTEPRFTITVEQVQTARSILIPATEDTAAQHVPANGVFVSVVATVEARRSPVYVAATRLHTRYGDYFPTDKFGGGLLIGPAITPLSYVRFQPGMPRRGAYVFDVPRGALAGASLYASDRVTDDAPFGFYRNDPVRFSAEAHIDLGIDAARAAGLTRAPVSDYEMPEPS
jgi:hypothetical protein